MATYDNAYSRFVVFAKIVLPLAALAVLSTLFLFSRSKETTLTIPYSDVETIARDQIIGEPTYTGVTRDGSAISIGAQSARPLNGNSSHMLADDIIAVIEMPNGRIVNIDANTGMINASDNQAALDGGVLIETSDGYTIETEGVLTSLRNTDVRSNGAVDADGPLGNLHAGAMYLTKSYEDDYLLVFNQGVKLVYDPKN